MSTYIPYIPHSSQSAAKGAAHIPNGTLPKARRAVFRQGTARTNLADTARQRPAPGRHGKTPPQKSTATTGGAPSGGPLSAKGTDRMSAIGLVLPPTGLAYADSTTSAKAGHRPGQSPHQVARPRPS